MAASFMHDFDANLVRIVFNHQRELNLNDSKRLKMIFDDEFLVLWFSSR